MQPVYLNGPHFDNSFAAHFAPVSSPKGRPLDYYTPPNETEAGGAVAKVESQPQLKIKKISGVVHVDTTKLSIAQFKTAIFAANSYPLTASYLGVPAITESRVLVAGEPAVVYQRTGGNAVVAPRHYVIAMKTAQETADFIKIECDLLPPDNYSQLLAQHPDHIYMRYSHLEWIYDKKAGTITYSLAADSGGNIPGFLVTRSALMAFPKEFLKVKFGIDAELED